MYKGPKHHRSIAFSCSLPQEVYNRVIAKASSEGLATSQMIALLLCPAVGLDPDAIRAGMRKARVPHRSVAVEHLLNPKRDTLPTDWQDLESYPYRTKAVYMLLLKPEGRFQGKPEKTLMNGEEIMLVVAGDLVNPGKSTEAQDKLRRMFELYCIDNI